MSEANVTLVRTVYERFRADDNEAALALLAPDIEVRDRPEAPDPQVYRGHQGVLDSLSSSGATFEDLEFATEEFIDMGDEVVVVFRFRGTGRVSGVPVDERLAHRWTIHGGRAVRMTVHSSRDEALE